MRHDGSSGVTWDWTSNEKNNFSLLSALVRLNAKHAHGRQGSLPFAPTGSCGPKLGATRKPKA